MGKSSYHIAGMTSVKEMGGLGKVGFIRQCSSEKARWGFSSQAKILHGTEMT